MRTAPAQPMHDTDQESSWWRGTVWSLARKAMTDWWNTIRQRSTMIPVEELRRWMLCEAWNRFVPEVASTDLTE